MLRDPTVAADPRFSPNSKRSAHRAELAAIIAAVFTLLTRAQVLERLDAAKIANASVNDMAGLWAHPQLAARNRWVDVETAAGPVPALLPPGQTGARMDAVPAVGQHTAAILAELGVSA